VLDSGAVGPPGFKSHPRRCRVIAEFHYTGPTGPDQTKSADFVGDQGLRPGSHEKVRAGPRRSGRARVVEFSLNSLGQTVHTRVSVHQAAKLVAALLRVAGVTAGLAAYRRVYDSRHLQADCQEPGSVPQPYMLDNRVLATFTLLSHSLSFLAELINE